MHPQTGDFARTLWLRLLSVLLHPVRRDCHAVSGQRSVLERDGAWVRPTPSDSRPLFRPPLEVVLQFCFDDPQIKIGNLRGCVGWGHQSWPGPVSHVYLCLCCKPQEHDPPVGIWSGRELQFNIIRFLVLYAHILVCGCVLGRIRLLSCLYVARACAPSYTHTHTHTHTQTHTAAGPLPIFPKYCTLASRPELAQTLPCTELAPKHSVFSFNLRHNRPMGFRQCIFVPNLTV